MNNQNQFTRVDKTTSQSRKSNYKKCSKNKKKQYLKMQELKKIIFKTVNLKQNATGNVESKEKTIFKDIKN